MCKPRRSTVCNVRQACDTQHTYMARSTRHARLPEAVLHILRCTLSVCCMCCIVALLVQLIPNAIFWFTGEAVSDDDYEEGEDEDEDEDEEDEDEEDDDDDEVRCS